MRSLPLVLLLLSATGCAFSLPAPGSRRAAALRADCDSWTEAMNKLTTEDRCMLTHSGVLLRNGRWYFSERLIPDCSVRIQIAEYFRSVVAGQVGIAERRFGWLYAADVSKITRAVWPQLGAGAAVPADGSFNSEKWGLLRQPWLKAEDLAAVLGFEIKKQGVSPEVAVCVLERPLLNLVVPLKTAATQARKSTTEVIFALVLLHVCGADGVLKQLAKLRTDTLRSDELTALREIQSKIHDGVPVLWGDLEPFVREW